MRLEKAHRWIKNSDGSISPLGDAKTVLPASTSTTVPVLQLGTTATGFNAPASDKLYTIINGSLDWVYDPNQLAGQNSAACALLNEAASSTNPTLCPNKAALTAGIGASAAGAVSLIGASVEHMRISSGDNFCFRPLTGSGSQHPQIKMDTESSATVPVIIPRRTDPNSGFGWQGTDAPCVTCDGVEKARWDTDATAGNTAMLIYDVDNAQMERVSVGAADSGGAGYKVLRIAN